MLKIHSGKFKGRVLSSIKGNDVRPTLDKIRAAIFDVLSNYTDITKFEVVDMFAGTGALGLEALSRGAIFAFFIDIAIKQVQCIKKNVLMLGVAQECAIIRKDTLQWIEQQNWHKKPRIFFIDPPYKKNIVPPVIDFFANRSEVFENNLLVVESWKNDLIHYPKNFFLLQQKIYGDTKIDFMIIKLDIA